MTFQDIVSLIKDIITTLAAVIAAYVAVAGLQAWKKQLKGRTEYELAQRLLRSTYKVRDAFENVRLFAVSGDEEQQAIKEAGINDSLKYSQQQAAVRGAVYNVRWQKVKEAFIDLDTVSAWKLK